MFLCIVGPYLTQYTFTKLVSGWLRSAISLTVFTKAAVLLQASSMPNIQAVTEYIVLYYYK